jgi:hypothetical protein
MDFTAPVLGVVVDKDMKVLHIEAESAAEQAGIQVGDILEMIEDVRFATERRKAKEIIGHNQNQQPLDLKLKRNNQDLVIKVIPTAPTFDSPKYARAGQAIPSVTPVIPPDDYL